MKAQNITQYFVRHKVIFWSLVASILIAGVLSFISMPKLEDPAVSPKQAMIVVPFPGASAHEVELKVAQVIEENLNTLPDVNRVICECENGMLMATVEFKMTVLNEELEQHFDLVRRKVNDCKIYLPQDCSSPIVIDDMTDVYGILYSFEGKGYSYKDLEKYAKVIRRELMTVDGVKRINICGLRSDVINISISKEQIFRNGLIPTQLAMSLQNSGKTVSGGNYTNGDNRYQIKVNNAVETVDDIKNLMIKNANGKVMKLGDIATVEAAYSEPQRNGFFVNGEPALAICVSMEKNAIVPNVGEAVDLKLEEVMKDIPTGMTTQKIFFQPDKVSSAVKNFMVNLLESVLIVIVVLIFAMGFRSGIIVGLGLILTIAMSFPILMLLDGTLQRISLGAFIIAMGMLVDNSIVIMDGILVDKERGLGPKKYLYRIGNNTAMPLLAATIIAVSTFLSVYLSPDTAGEYCKDLFLVLCVSLLSSWILALIQVPVCAKNWLPARINSDKSKKKGKGTDTRMHRFVQKWVSTLIDHKKVTIISAIVILGLSGFGMTKVKNLFFPDFDYNQFVVEYYLPSQTSPDKVKADLLEMTDYLKPNKDIVRISASMGSAPSHYCLVRPMTNGGDRYGELIIDCKDYETVDKVINEIRDDLREKYPDAYIRYRRYNFSISTSHTVEAVFQGPDPAVLRNLSQQAEAIMRECPYVDQYSVGNNWMPKGKALVADYNMQDALRAGIQRSDVANALAAATDGMPIGVINQEDNMTVINLNVRNADGSKIEDLEDIPVWSTMNINLDPDKISGLMTGQTDMAKMQEDMFKGTLLSNIANDVHLEWNDDYIYRENGKRTIEVQCDPDITMYEATPAKILGEIRSKIENIELPDGYSMKWGGENGTQTTATKNIIKYVPITLFMIIIILLFLFNSWKKLFIVIACVPFVICGITPTLLIFHQPFTFMAIIGVMGLMGMMIKNSIVLIDEINRLQNEESMLPYNAVVTATVSRVRPVVLASLTTILGMLPLLGDPMFGSMALVIMSGLTIGTIITLILLPILYSAMYHVRKPIK